MSYPADKDQFNLTAEGCEPNSLVITDDPILYGIRENLEGIAQEIESCLKKWSSDSFKYLKLVRLTAPDYKEEHHYEIYFVDQIPPNQPLARTSFPGSINNPGHIWFNSKYEFLYDNSVIESPRDRGKYLFSTVLMHELGHSLCLHHICDKESAVMYPSIPPFTSNDDPSLPWFKVYLTDDDIAILRAKYPH